MPGERRLCNRSPVTCSHSGKVGSNAACRGSHHDGYYPIGAPSKFLTQSSATVMARIVTGHGLLDRGAACLLAQRFGRVFDHVFTSAKYQPSARYAGENHSSTPPLSEYC